MDYRRMYDDKEMLYSYDLEEFNGQDAVFQIKSVSAGELIGQKGRKSKKPFITFHDPDGKLHGKRLAANKTNGKSIAKMYSKDASKWIGQWIAMYVTTVDYDGEITDCIRVRPQRPEMQRPAQNDRGSAPRPSHAEPLLLQLSGCSDPDVFAAIEKQRAEVWNKLSKDEKLRVKLAVDEASARIAAATQDSAAPLSAEEQAEIARREAEEAAQS